MVANRKQAPGSGSRRGARLAKIDTMLVRMIGNSKGQFIALLTIIIMGIATYSALNMTTENMNQTLNTYYAQTSFPDLFLQTGAVPERALDRLEEIDGVKQAMGRVTMDVPMVANDENERVNLRLVTITGREDELSKVTLLRGNMPSGGRNQVLLIEQFAAARGINPGDEIRIQAGGVQYKLEVAGIVANPEYIYMMESAQTIIPDDKAFGVCYVSEELGQQVTGLNGSYNEILIRYDKNADEDALIDQVDDALHFYGVRLTIKQADQLSNLVIRQKVDGMARMASSLPIVFLLVAGLILIMMLSRLVKKDRIKIGVLKAIGYNNSQVLFHYVKYALILGILGGAAGAFLGMAMSGGLTKVYLAYFKIPLLRIEFYYSYLVSAILLSAIFCAVSGTIGARGVLKITPADSMHSEPPKAGKRILLEKIKFFWRRLSFSNKMVIKNIFRSKKRTIFVVAGITLTYALMLFSSTLPSVMNQMVNEHFVEFQKMDYNIGFRTPVPRDTVRDMEHLIHVDYIEGKLEYPFELTNGNKKQSVSIIGLDRNTRFYAFHNLHGEKTEIPSSGMLVSENLATALGVQKGDMVLVKSYIPNREDAYIQVKGVIKQVLGMNAFMDIGFMGETLLEKNTINGVFADSKDPNINEELIRAANISSIMSIDDMRSVYADYMDVLNASITVMLIFAGILGFCIVYNTTIVSLGEREMEFSSLRVLGFGKMEIFFMVLRENNIMLFSGILLGIPIGYAFTKLSSSVYSTDIYTLDMTPTLNAFIVAAVSTIVFVLLAELATYRKIKKMDFLQALKNRES